MFFEDKEATNPNLNLFLNYIIVLSYLLELKNKENSFFLILKQSLKNPYFLNFGGPKAQL